MKKVIVVFGYGPGISQAVAKKFGAEGFAVAVVGRTPTKLAAGVAELEAAGVQALAITADAGEPAQVQRAIAEARAGLGPIHVVQWTAYGGGAGDLTTAGVDELQSVFDVAIVGLTTAVQAALPDLEKSKGAVLVTNGGLGLFDANIDAVGANYGLMGLSMANSAKHKLVRLLNLKLSPKNIHVGEVMVLGTIKGTSFDRGATPTIDPSLVADLFWSSYEGRSEVSVQIA